MQNKNLADATVAPVRVWCNMQIKVAITEISFFGNSSLNIQDKRMKIVSSPRFSGSVVKIRPLPK